jgi:hypothetical protein
MRGTDLTDEQIAAARQFILDRAGMTELPDEREIVQRFGNLVRIVAWYGAIRFDACQRGIGTLTKPNPTGMTLVSVKKGPADANQ